MSVVLEQPRYIRDYRPPAWHEAGLCARPGRDPREWDAATPMRVTVAENTARALGLCEGCPVIRECALEALVIRCDGTVRAGIPLVTGRLTAGQAEALGYIGDGVPARLAAAWAGLVPRG